MVSESQPGKVAPLNQLTERKIMNKKAIEIELQRRFPGASKQQVRLIRQYADKVLIGGMTLNEAEAKIGESE